MVGISIAFTSRVQAPLHLGNNNSKERITEMKLDSLEKLYAHELKDLWSAENQIVKALEGLVGRIKNEVLEQAVQDHLKETRGQLERLQKIFDSYEFGAHGHHCKGMEGLLTEAGEILSEEGTQEVLEAGLIAALQRVEHYEIAAYGTARAYAEKLGHKEHADLLTQSLEEEGKADRHLTQLAERSLNFRALAVAL